MLIRSQDKKKIFNLEQIRKIDCETNSVMADDVSVMGTYSTEELVWVLLHPSLYFRCQVTRKWRCRP